MKNYYFLWLALPVGMSLPFIVPGCAGTLTEEEKEALMTTSSTTNSTTTSMTTGGGCVPAVFAKSCSATANCHGPDMPALPDFQLTADGFAAANDGMGWVDKAASGDSAALCGPASDPPVMGK